MYVDSNICFLSVCFWGWAREGVLVIIYSNKAVPSLVHCFPHEPTCMTHSMKSVCLALKGRHQRQGAGTSWLYFALLIAVVCGFLTVPRCTIRRLHSDKKKTKPVL